MHQAQAVQERVGSTSRTRWWMAGMLAVIACGCLARFWMLGSQSLWFDEGYSAWVVSLSPGRIVEVIRHDVSPPLYYLLLWQWTQWFGDSETALRSLSAVASCLTIPVAGAIAWRMTRSGGAALLSMILMSLSVLHIQYAQEARSYGLASLLAAVALYAAVRRMGGSAGWMALVFVMLACCVYLHNMMWFYVAGLGLAYLVMPGGTKFWRRVAELAAMGVGLVLVYAWWIPSLLGQVRWLQGNFWANVPSGNDLTQVLVAVSGMKVMHLSAVMNGAMAGWFVLIVLVGIAAMSLVGRSRDEVRWAAAMLLFGLAPVLAVFAYAQMSQSYFVEKVFTASSISIPLLGALLVRSRLRWAGAVLIPALVLGSALSVWGYFSWERKEDWRGAMTYVDSIPRQGVQDTLGVNSSAPDGAILSSPRREPWVVEMAQAKAPVGAAPLVSPLPGLLPFGWFSHGSRRGLLYAAPAGARAAMPPKVSCAPRQGALVVFVANEGELLYEYYQRRQGGLAHAATGAPQGFHELQPQKTIQRVLGDADTLKLRERLRQERPERVILVLAHTHYSDPEMLTRKAVEQEMRLIEESNFHLVDVLEFGR